MRAASALVVAVGLGLALAASVYIGWLVAQFASAAVSIIFGPILIVIMLTVLFAVKFVRLPSAPLVGDGFEILGVIYVLPGAFGALLGRVPRLRVPETAAVRNGRWVTGAALAIGAAWYLFYAVMAASGR